MTYSDWIAEEEEGLITDLWPDAARMSTESLDSLLNSAYAQCSKYAPALSDTVAPQDVPAEYKTALVLQARALWRSTKSGDNDSIGYTDVSVTVFPMDWTVKNLLRPQTGVPVVF